MVSQKRIFIAAAGGLAATLALAGCGSDSYGLSKAQSAAIGAAPAAAPAEDLASTPAEEPIKKDDGDDSDDPTATDPTATASDPKAAARKVSTKPVGKVSDKLIATTVPRMGHVVKDAKGWVLYRFDKDKAKPSRSNCVGDCAILWPPLLADDTLELSGLDASKVDTVERADGGLQVTIAGWPVYRYIGDKKPGSWEGQNVLGKWFVIEKDGRKNLTCLPKISKPVPLPGKGKGKDTGKSEAAAVARDDDDASSTGTAASAGY